jgi:LuxR family maltose regulon positive regulatory protein
LEIEMARIRTTGSPAPVSASILSGLLVQSVLRDTVAGDWHCRPDRVERALERTLVAEVFRLLAGPVAMPPESRREQPGESLTETEARVLRYLPTNLSKREIASELYVSVHTVRTHVKHLYAKLDAHSRGEAVRRAREIGLLPHGPARIGRFTPGRLAIGGESV